MNGTYTSKKKNPDTPHISAGNFGEWEWSGNMCENPNEDHDDAANLFCEEKNWSGFSAVMSGA